MEEFPKRIEGKKLHTLEMAAALAVAISAADAAPAQAIEIPPNTSWQMGIEHSVREAVLNEKHEQSAIYVQFTDGSGTWLPSVQGKAEEVRTDAWEVDREARRFNKPIENICLLHTHPIEVNRKSIKIPGIDSASIPIAPSGIPGDIETASSHTNFPSDVHFTFGAVDGRGIWYFSKSREPVNSQIDQARFFSEYGKFIQASVEQGFNIDAALPELQQAYKQYLHAEVRFVPYEKVGNEAPCAGAYPTGHSSPPAHDQAHVEAPAKPDPVAHHDAGSAKSIDLTQPTFTIRLPE